VGIHFTPRLLPAVGLVVLAFGAPGSCAPTPEVSSAPQTGCLTGTLHVVWNHTARFFLVPSADQDAAGAVEAEVLIADSLLAALGGPLALQDASVRISGEWREGPPPKLRAEQIEVSPQEGDRCP